MKVTEEMADRACTYLNRYYDGKCDLDDARGALEAALQDVPEPSDLELTLLESWPGLVKSAMTLNAKLEAKLTKISEWVDLWELETKATRSERGLSDWEHGQSVGRENACNEISAILEGA